MANAFDLELPTHHATDAEVFPLCIGGGIVSYLRGSWREGDNLTFIPMYWIRANDYNYVHRGVEYLQEIAKKFRVSIVHTKDLDARGRLEPGLTFYLCPENNP